MTSTLLPQLLLSDSSYYNRVLDVFFFIVMQKFR